MFFKTIDMNVVKIYGGLGNQMFQYAFGKLMSSNGIDVCYENSFYRIPQKLHPRPYHLDKYGLDLRFSSFRSQKIIHDSGYMPELLKTDNINLHGYWQYLDYYKPIITVLQEEFKVLDTEYTEDFLRLREVVTGCKSASLHVRRGDYITIEGHHNLSLVYYLEAVALCPEIEALFIFSDDIPWCRETFQKDYFNKEIYFVEIEDYLSLELMSLCNINIIANSTFSWWAAMLNTNYFKKVIAPIIWRLGVKEQEKMEDGLFVPTNWIRL